MLMGIRLRGFAIAAAALLAAAPVSALAQEEAANEPVVVVSITNFNRLMNDINYVATAIGQSQASGMVQGMAGLYTNGLDKTRPIVVAFPVLDGVPAPLGAIPTTDVKLLLRAVEGVVGPPDDLGDGTLAIAAGPNIIFIRQQEDWAYVTANQELLKSLPADPVAWLHGMGDDYDIGVRVNVRALSPAQRMEALEAMRQGFEGAMAMQPEEQAAQIREMGEQSLKQLETVINETELLQFGFAIQPDQQRLMMEIVSTAAAGTDLAKASEDQRAIPSKFAAVIQPEVAGYFHGATSISDLGIEQAKLSLEQSTASVRTALEQVENLSEEDRAELENFFDKLIQIGIDTIAEGKTDAGGMFTLENQELNAVAGFFVSDGNKVAALAKELAAKIEEKTGGSANLRFSFDAAEYSGVTMHYIDTDVPASEEEAQMIFGETLRLTIGTGEDVVYLGLGKQSEALLKGLIDSSSEDTVPADRPYNQATLNLLPILEFAQSIAPSEPVAAMIDGIVPFSEVDSLGIRMEAIERGSVVKFTLGEGVLRAVGGVLSAQQQQAPAGAF